MRTVRTEQNRSLILAALAEGHSYTVAAKCAGVSRSVLFDWRRADPGFDQACLDAEEEGTDTLEDEAIRRARDGVLRPVFHKGERCGEVREYSDAMMAIMLKARRPEKYRERSQVEHTGAIDTMTDEQLDARIAELVARNAPAAPAQPGRKARAGTAAGGQGA